MILYTSREQNIQAQQRRKLIIYLAVTAFCLLFSTIYNQFSHGVTSPYMSFLCLWPLLLGAVPAFMLMLLNRDVPIFVSDFWSSGVAALTVHSALLGVFEIANTSSPMTAPLFWIGVILLIIAAVSYGVTLLKGE